MKKSYDRASELMMDNISQQGFSAEDEELCRLLCNKPKQADGKRSATLVAAHTKETPEDTRNNAKNISNRQEAGLTLRISPALPRIIQSASPTAAAATTADQAPRCLFSCSSCGAAFTDTALRCSRCSSDDALYCDRSCQAKDWPRHSQVCNPLTGEGNRAFSGGDNYIWITPEFPETVWKQSDLTLMSGDSFDMDPPERLRSDHPRLFDAWFPRSFYIAGEPLFEAAFLPSCIIHAIREGLQKRSLCWDYLVSGNFFSIITHAGMPVHKTLIYIKQLMQVLDPKPHASRLLEMEMERYWIIQCSLGRNEFCQEMCDILDINNIRRNDISICAESCDDMRLVTHKTASALPACDCYFCQSRALLEVRKKKIWVRISYFASVRRLFARVCPHSHNPPHLT